MILLRDGNPQRAGMYLFLSTKQTLSKNYNKGQRRTLVNDKRVNSPGGYITIIIYVPKKKFSHYCKSSRAHNRFPSLGIGKETENPQGIWLWRPVGFDYRTPTGLGKQNLGGHKQTLCTPGLRRKEQWPQKWGQTCLWASRSLWWRCGPTVACHRVRDTEYNFLGSCGECWHKSFWRRSPIIVWSQA